VYRAHIRLLLSFTLAGSCFALGHSKRISEIDDYCSRVQKDVGSVSPFVFSGPDPWVQLDEVPASMPDEALAFVYTVGPDVRWVFLRMVDRDEGWTEDVNYFFRQDGAIVKRVRQVRSAPANLVFDVTTYYEAGRILKERTHHHALGQGRQDVSAFNDPDAPAFWSVDDLPFPDIPDLWRRLA
jgi:hypothetical protein